MTGRFPCLHIEGGLLASDLMDQIADGIAIGQKPVDFGLGSHSHLTDEISSAWASARNYWEAFHRRMERGVPGDPLTSITRDQWMIPLLSLLGYELTYQPRAAEVDGQTYAISHRATPSPLLPIPNEAEGPPVHIIGCRQSLDHRSESGRPRLAPHSLLQEYLNRTEHLWGMVTNGYRLRLLRDSHLMRRQSFIEFDLQQMLEGERFADFALFYRLIHRSRLPQEIADAAECLLERYYDTTVEQGGRVRDRLRDGVEEAIKILANGFLHHPRNSALREKVRSKALRPLDFYQQLLRLIYRLLFLMVAEERNLITENHSYRTHYSITHLRNLAENRAAYTGHEDLWLGLRTTFQLFYQERIGRLLEVPPLNGALFNLSQTDSLTDLSLYNYDLLTALRKLSIYRENDRSPWRHVNYAALDVEELGSVYESLLDFLPIFAEQNGKPAFELSPGTERKSTGSYYTHQELVHELVNSALVPVLEERLKPAKTLQEKEQAILSIKVCDPACGSGHFLLAAARGLGRELAKVRSGEDEPGPEKMRLAIRDVITHSIYGVDKNPLAVELCKVALWIEGHYQGKPLTFLDHRIRCGDSLIGVGDLAILRKGIPDGAFIPVTGDDQQAARTIKQRNRRERAGQQALPFPAELQLRALTHDHHPLLQLSDDTLEHIREKAETYQGLQRPGTAWWQGNTSCHLWTAAFFAPLLPTPSGSGVEDKSIPTTDSLRRYLENPHAAYGPVVGNVWALALQHHFFHWPLEFPEVFAQGGFDVVLCNPPWERIKLQDQEFFAAHDQEIALAPNKSARQRLIQQLRHNNPDLWREYQKALHDAEALSKYLRHSGFFSLAARGDINTYAVFAEIFTRLIKPSGRAGVVLPTGIATDDTNKHFFCHLVDSGRLVSLYDFENRQKLFPEVDSRYKFCLLTLRGKDAGGHGPARFAFFLTRTEHLREGHRVFSLDARDFAQFNPNTRTCPVFRTRADANLTRKIYQRVPVLINETTGENPWGIRFFTMFHMANDSHLFRTHEQLESKGYRLIGNRFIKDDELWLPLYEAKMIWQFNHRFGTYEGVTSRSSTHLPTPSTAQYTDPSFVIQPWYWVSADQVNARLGNWKPGWLLGFRDVTNATNERTAIFSLLTRVGVGHKMPLIFTERFHNAPYVSCILANVNGIAFDFVVRQKIGGTSLGFFLLKQLPVMAPTAYTSDDLLFIVPRVLELVYTAWDIKPFADDVWREADETLRAAIRHQWDNNRVATGGHLWQPPEWAEIATDGIPLPPFKWDEDRRARLCAELDAYYARLYGLTDKELRYILDPRDVYGDDFPGETFRVLKEKEIRQYGEYRTRRLVLEAWEGLSQNNWE